MPSSEPNVFEAQAAGLEVKHPHRTTGRAPALCRATRIEDLEATVPFVQRHVAVTEDDGVGIRKSPAQPLQPSACRAGVMEDRENPVSQHHLTSLRQRSSENGFVDIPVDGTDDGAKPFKLLQDREGGEVTGMDQGVRPRDQLGAPLGQAASPLRHVGVGEKGDRHLSVLS